MLYNAAAFSWDSEAHGHLIVTCVFDNLSTDTHQFGNSHLVKFWNLSVCSTLPGEILYTGRLNTLRLLWSLVLIWFWPIQNVPPALINTWAIFSQELAVTESTGRMKRGKYQPRGKWQKGMKVRTSSVLCSRQPRMINFLDQVLKFESLRVKSSVLSPQVAEQEQTRSLVRLWIQQLIPIMLFCICIAVVGERSVMKWSETGALALWYTGCFFLSAQTPWE